MSLSETPFKNPAPQELNAKFRLTIAMLPKDPNSWDEKLKTLPDDELEPEEIALIESWQNSQSEHVLNFLKPKDSKYELQVLQRRAKDHSRRRKRRNSLFLSNIYTLVEDQLSLAQISKGFKLILLHDIEARSVRQEISTNIIFRQESEPDFYQLYNRITDAKNPLSGGIYESGRAKAIEIAEYSLLYANTKELREFADIQKCSYLCAVDFLEQARTSPQDRRLQILKGILFRYNFLSKPQELEQTIAFWHQEIIEHYQYNPHNLSI